MKSVEFTVAAIAGDQGSERISEANVVLQLVDVNDNAPVFDQVNILLSSKMASIITCFSRRVTRCPSQRMCCP